METEENKALLNHRKFAEIIKASGLTQEEFAEEVGISDRYVRCLKNQNKDISVSLAYNISRKSGCSIESMLTIQNNENKHHDEVFIHCRQQIVQAMELLHSVKNSLQNISGLLSILSLRCEQHGITIKTMAPIRQELNEIIASLSEYLQKTPHQINICCCSLNQLIQEVVQYKEAQFMASQIQLHTRLADDLPLIYLDRHYIRQVLLDCLNNSHTAILTKGQPGGQIIISTQLIEDAKMVQILLQDNGIGLTPEQRANFFTPYYTTKIHGNGIGTAICQAIVKLHGGTMSVNGRRDVGCCVRIELPVRRVQPFNHADLYTEIADMLL